jgi:LysM repeat protein
LESRAFLNRRTFLAGSLAGAATLLAGRGSQPARAATRPKHLVWVWQLTADGEPQFVAPRLRDFGLGIILKTHDGVTWMSEYDKSPYAVSGPAQVAVLANYFENAGVPFHAWCVPHGTDPAREAQMVVDVLAAGARSVYLDIEPSSGFWRGTPEAAAQLGEHIRRQQPNAKLSLSIDARPWMLPKLPMNEFLAYTDEISPQQYWRTFNTPANYARYVETGFPVPPEGVTPEFLLGVSNIVLASYGKPVAHVGQGATPDPNEMRRFIGGAFASNDHVSIWRYGVTTGDVMNVLLEMMPPEPPPPPALVSAAGGVYVVQEGDTLGLIAEAYGTTVEELMANNGLTDANYIYVGQELVLPGGTIVASGASEPAASGGGGGTSGEYTVQDGDTLYGIAGRFGTSADAIASLNGISDPNFLSIGQVLKIP